MPRPNKLDYYLDIARSVSKRSTCLRRRYGAVIVNNDEIVSTGYNGAPRGYMNCIDRGSCIRENMSVNPGERYELCEAIHAEQNAIISASRKDMMGGVLYLYGEDKYGNEIEAKPCALCERFIINVGIVSVFKSK